MTTDLGSAAECSTLTRLATRRQPTVVRLLDDPATLEHDTLMVIDEISWFRNSFSRSR
jgi:hypothetical protein